MLTNEAIEVHLTYLRTGLDAVQAALPVLRDKIDLLSAKIDSRNASSTNYKAGRDAFDERMDRLTEWNAAYKRIMRLLIPSIVIIELAFIARTLGWI